MKVTINESNDRKITDTIIHGTNLESITNRGVYTLPKTVVNDSLSRSPVPMILSEEERRFIEELRRNKDDNLQYFTE